ncbi:uncharacterized protein LOC119310705 [Triticum dicoccoides]|uniref:uncharacterized protein LOC119310705 n=1 Tax=Triticum dicoccoides TaxID=85692 RepID=UPI00189032F5|nr:uncharacterized protein LOC119310705 [Triticum dicoccoides]XP_044374987.1 uncharacterized protein LOC123097337 [Triticum aestivum]
MARLSATTTALLLATVVFFIAAGAAEAGPTHNGDAVTKDFILARGIKLHISKQGTATDHIFAGGSKLFIARHDAAPADHALAGGSKLFIARHDAAPADHASARGSKLDVTQSKISIPKKRLAVSQSKASVVQKKGFIFLEGRKLAAGGGALPSADTAGAAPGAVQACDQLEAYQRVCHTLLHLPGVTTARTLMETAVRVALGRARAAKVTFDAAKAASGAGNPMASILGSCEQNYDDLVDALEEVSRAMHKPGTSSESLVEKMTAASTYAGDCDNWYEERDVKSPYEVMQRHLAQMVSVALGLANKKL